ncbi:GNAT family N-acetyltransferase [Commensalibacter papalotli (ex Botero et al. 2024)]|uniref:Ribosomal protein S18 acetylase RimI and related acetyltransferases (RimI) (PDB:1GHE) n=1 Tax=Commensalibacter papalotli (ex Botero et al. 2024) TaxID=2972766 RepID=A0ABM9HK23_9PROT|nr:GNAT family N-acetyltransferase [Commensalibacter papalotli (ex Botero et al. 2024)]CAI3922752.1 Ribosomal protein S18 acetylase RimI and related acetyltransferases (RimI) (PDB:1GHE) [Commensalibacter papalotli (ex Botero et al. 2024)]CAI3929335.1 Ribosomal protein S18 acetylase RimI and related acetyltransferases (RimI) (PDB:1GHE) [Commensalibacter papalotli (ex Botero et al. 2024)]
MIIEKVTRDKIGDLQQVARKSFFDTFVEFNTQEDMNAYLQNNLSVEQLTKELLHPQSDFFIVKYDQDYVGYIKLNYGTAQNEFQEDNALEIERLYVLQQYHRKQIGQSLFNYALEIAHKKSVDYVWLGVWEKNLKAISFYQKNGLTAFDKHEFILGKDIQTDILMRKYITISSE